MMTRTTVVNQPQYDTADNKEKLIDQTSSSYNNRIFAPLNIPLYRRCQTLAVLVWFILPWFCLYLTFYLLRSDRWYLTAGLLLYLGWMFIFRTHPKKGGNRQQWFRRLIWWKWFTGMFLQCHCYFLRKSFFFIYLHF